MWMIIPVHPQLAFPYFVGCSFAVQQLSRLFYCLLFALLGSGLVVLSLLLLSENTWQNQSNKGSVYFNQSAGVARSVCRRSSSSREMTMAEHAADHLSSTGKNQQEMGARAQFPFLILFCHLTECCLLHLQWVF